MNKTILTLIAFAVLAIASTAQASEPSTGSYITLDVNLASYHTQAWARDQLNQRNPGVGLTYHLNRTWAFSTGGYYNSYRRATVYALAAWTPLQFGAVTNWHVDAGVAAGLATGYRRNEIACRPFAGGVLVRVAAPSGVSVNLFAVPGTGAHKSGFVGLQFSVPFSRRSQ